MQNKGAIRFLAILLAVVCAYYLMFTFKAYQVKQDAKAYANGDPLKMKSYLDSMQNEEVMSFPRTFTYREVMKRQINLGLDLRGGVNVTLEIALADVLKELSADENDETFLKILAKAKEMQKQSQDDFITLFARAQAEVEPNGKMIDYFYTPKVVEKLGDEPSNDDVIAYLQEKSDDAIGQIFEVLRVRVQTFGIAQPNIQKIGNTGKIEVELPGVYDVARVRSLLSGSANLQFWDVYFSNEVVGKYAQINELLKTRPEYAKKEEAKEVASNNESDVDDLGLELEGDSANSLDSLGLDLDEDIASSMDKEPLDILFGGTAGSFKSAFDQYARSPRPEVGVVKVGDINKVNEILNDPEVKRMFPRNVKFLWENISDEASNGAGTKQYVQLYAIKNNSIDGKAPLEGDIITDASPDFDENGQQIVRLSMTGQGASIWAEMTKKACETKPNRHIAIVLDDYVYSAPVVMNPIPSGNTQITVGGGDNAANEAKVLATVLKAGRFPAPVKIVDQSVVGPSLGEEAISAGFFSFCLALVMVLLYMAFYYSTAGWVSNVALLANVFFIIGVLAAFPTISLTLPGVAGIVLTLGMAVDANVLIYERIREELRAGKGLKLSIRDGYKGAYSAILDANVTSLVVGIILWYFGSGPVLGFAKTLVIGILTSLFSSIFITRLIFERLMTKKSEIAFISSTTDKWFKNLNINFVRNRKKFYMVSLVIIGAGIISFMTNGFDLGTDFTGGRKYKVRFESAPDIAQLTSALETKFVDENGGKLTPEIKVVSGNNDVIIKTKYLFNSEDDNASNLVDKALYEGVSSFYSNPLTFEQFGYETDTNSEGKLGIMDYRMVGPTIADDIINAAFMSITIALLFIFLYIVARFRKVHFGLGALVAIFHDVMIVLSLFSIGYAFLPISLEVNQAFIAAILTVVGYSINDTVVVFDRIREYLKMTPDKDLATVTNNALNSTLSRTFNTSITIFFVLLMIFLFGGSAIQGFAFALLVGVVAGTYSSICIATPIVVDFAKREKE